MSTVVSALIVPISLFAYLSAGVGLGTLYFGRLWSDARLLLDGKRMWVAVACVLGRFTVLAGVLTLVSFRGAMPLLMITLGLLTARSFVMRRARRVA